MTVPLNPVPARLEDLTLDVTIVSANTGDLIVRSSGGQWVNLASASGFLKATGAHASPAWSAIAESDVVNLAADLAAKATDSLVVHLAGVETITGSKVFSANVDVGGYFRATGSATPSGGSGIEFLFSGEGFIFSFNRTTAAWLELEIDGSVLALNKTSAGSVVVGAALATTATTGFLHIPAMAGTPTGTPVAHTGTVALCYDTVGKHLWIFNGSSWEQH